MSHHDDDTHPHDAPPEGETNDDSLLRSLKGALGGPVPTQLPEALMDLDPQEAVTLGEMLSERYAVERHVAEGGMGRIYKATDTTTGRHVAIKVIRNDMATLEDRLRFQQEARAMSAVQHPNVASVLSVDEVGGSPFMVIEWLEGEPLSGVIGEDPLPIREAVEVALDVARALDCAHGRGVVHRDVKPSNVVVTPAEGGRRARLLDFGVAHLHDSLLNDEGRMIGTLLYMAPEQLKAIQSRVDARSDLYSLGVMMFQLLTGQLPMKKKTLFGLMVEHRQRRPPLAHTVAPSVHPQLSRIVARLLALEPADRYHSAKGLIADLERWLQAPESSFEVDQNEATRALEDKAPLTGRDATVSWLGDVWDETGHGSGTGVLICGAEGVGKTRLLNEVFGPRGLRTGAGHFLKATQFPASCVAPYQTLTALFDAYMLRTEAGQSSEGRVAVATRLLEEVGPLAPLLTSSLASARRLLGAMADEDVPALNRGSDRDRQIDVVARAMLALATPEEPITYALDDLQWANPTTLAVVARMLQLASHGDRPVTVVAVWSGQTPPPDLQSVAAHTLNLAPLSSQGSAEVIAGMLQSGEPPQSLVEAVWEQASGVPFLIEEHLRMAVLNGELAYTLEQGWTFSPSDRTSAETSASDAARRVRRIAALSQDARRLLSAAAVLEHPSTLEELVATLEAASWPAIAPARLLELLALLAREERLLSRFGSRYAFRHRHIQQNLIGELDEAEEVHLHRAALQVLAELPEVDAERLAWHASRSTDAEAILTYVPPVAETAAHSYANEDAERWYGLLLQTAPDHEDAPAWREARADALYLLGRYEQALAALETLLEDGDALEQSTRLRLMRKRADVDFGQGDLQQAGVDLEAILEVLGRQIGPPAPPNPNGPPPGLVPAGPDEELPALDEATLIELSTCERLNFVYAFSNPKKVIPVTLRMADVAGRYKTNRWRALAATVMGFGLTRQGKLGPAAIYFKHAGSMLEAAGTPLDRAWFDYSMSRLLIARGDLEGAFAHLTEAGAAFRRHGEQWNRLTCATTGAVVAWFMADLESMYKMIANAREVMEHTRSDQHRLWVRRWELTLAFLAGQLDQDGVAELEALVPTMLAARDLLAAIMTLVRCAEIALERGDPRAALGHTEQAIGLMEEHQQFEAWLPRLYLYRLEALLAVEPAEGEDRASLRERARGELPAIERWAGVFPLLAATPTDARASLALSEGDLDQALGLLAEARDSYASIGYRRRAWEMERRRIGVLQATGDAAWRQAAHDLRATCLEQGWAFLVNELDALLDGVAPPPPPSDRRPGDSHQMLALQRSEVPPDAISTDTHQDAATMQTLDAPRSRPGYNVSRDESAVLTRAFVRCGATRGVLFKLTGEGEAASPQPVAWLGLSSRELFGPSMAAGRRLVGELEADPCVTTNFTADQTRDLMSSIANDMLRAVAVVPLGPDEGDDRAALYLDRPYAEGPFSKQDLAAVAAMARAVRVE